LSFLHDLIPFLNGLQLARIARKRQAAKANVPDHVRLIAVIESNPRRVSASRTWQDYHGCSPSDVNAECLSKIRSNRCTTRSKRSSCWRTRSSNVAWQSCFRRILHWSLQVTGGRPVVWCRTIGLPQTRQVRSVVTTPPLRAGLSDIRQRIHGRGRRTDP
jgi:hypothetical protein